VAPSIGIFTTVHVCSLAALGALRVLVTSILENIPRDEYTVLLIVDDCSPPSVELDAYYAFLVETGTAQVYRMGPSALPYWIFKYGSLPPGEAISFGHAVGLMAGFHALREAGCTHAWVIDGDCAVLRSDVLHGACRVLEETGATVVADAYGCHPAQDPQAFQMIDGYHHLTYSRGGPAEQVSKALRPCRAAWALYGFPVMFCALVNLADEVLFGAFENTGWVNARWGYRFFRGGGTVGYYPFFQNGGVFHLGFGFTRPNLNVAEQTYGNARETARYGGKENGYHHAGYLQLQRSTVEHQAWLEAAAIAPPTDKPRMNPAWLKVPSPGVCGHDQVFLRPFLPADLPAVEAFDADAESCRFMRWTPGSTEAFVTRGNWVDHPWRWFVLSNAEGTTLAWGELRPLPPTELPEHPVTREAERAFGLSYATAVDQRRRGYAKQLIQMLYEAAYSQLDADLLLVRIDCENTASILTFKHATQGQEGWTELEPEAYTLHGVPGRQRVFARQFGRKLTLPEARREDALRAREQLLFDTLRVARP